MHSIPCRVKSTSFHVFSDIKMEYNDLLGLSYWASERIKSDTVSKTTL